jgi:ferredoxin-NADP reductase
MVVQNLLEPLVPLHCGMYVALQHIMNDLIDTDRTIVFLLIAGGLGACFVWAFWELEQMAQRWRKTRLVHLQRAAQRRAWRSGSGVK